ncbi:MAG: DUF3987 domain-containing protein [Bacteroidales bacterium]|nr:DUF3987 domain-containing protein [Bacteroidales bacterium]
MENLNKTPDSEGTGIDMSMNNKNAFQPSFDLKAVNISGQDIIAEATKLIGKLNEAKTNGANPFPVHCLPEQIQEIITATNANLKYPVDFIGASILFAASVAAGICFRVEVTKGWLETSVIYIAIVAPPGTNKSHPLSFAVKPIIDKDTKSYHKYELELCNYKKIIDVQKKEREQQDLKVPVKPVWIKFLLSDFTPEAIAEVHKVNKRGIGVYADELASWFKNFNRYKNGSEMEFWLSAWSAKPINIDRKTSDSIFIPFPFIPVCGTIQTGILQELAKDSRSQNGFIDRILFVFPDNIIKQYWSDTELDQHIIDNWNTIITNLLDLKSESDENKNPIPKTLKFTPEARQLLFEWQVLNTDRINEADSESKSGIYSKLEMYAIRLALILEQLRYACNNSALKAISIEATRGAIELVEYFGKSALKVNAIISNSSPLFNLSTDKQELYLGLPDSFTTDEGLEVAHKFSVPERTFKRFINERELFNRASRGVYIKRV